MVCILNAFTTGGIDKNFNLLKIIEATATQRKMIDEEISKARSDDRNIFQLEDVVAADSHIKA